MKGNLRKVILVSIITIIFVSIACISTRKRNTKIATTILSNEDKMAINYNELDDNSASVVGCDNILFNAYFVRDLKDENGNEGKDGYAEKYDGTCKNINGTDTLYFDLNVLTEGTLEDGIITISGSNFDYKMYMNRDEILKYDYKSNDVTKIELNSVNAGTQKLFFGKVIADIGNDTTNYSNNSTITLTGKYYETPTSEPIDIVKECNLTVDWYGNVSSSIKTYNSTYYYDELTSNTISFTYRVFENENELLLKDFRATACIPQINGVAPEKITAKDYEINQEYDSETGNTIVTLTKSSKVNEGGITEFLSRDTFVTVNVTYPEEAFYEMTSYSQIVIPVTGQYIGYNNTNTEYFENPIESNISEGNVIINFEKKPEPTGYIYNFDVKLTDKRWVTRPTERYVMSKQELLNLYGNEDLDGNFEYTVSWYASRGNLGIVNSFTLSEDTEKYGDTIDDINLNEHTAYTGIYFSNADNSLGEDGEIKVYDNDTNNLITTFTKDNWNIYNKDNPYRYEQNVKHIRVETTKASNNTTIAVHNIKMFDGTSFIENYTKDEVKNMSVLKTYLKGVVDIEENGKSEINDYDFAYLTADNSHVKLEISQKEATTIESTNEKFYINAVQSQLDDVKWKNGLFVIELPEEYINVELKNININNSKVKITATDVYQENGKYLIRIMTQNETLATYQITVDADLTPDSRIPTTRCDFKLYAYNEACNDYYYTENDIYDVDNDNNKEEFVAISSQKIDLYAPTSLIALQTISNYNNDNDITIAPNVADVEREARTARVNINITNNYPNIVTGVRIIGKIPYEGNTTVINKKNMKSEFDTEMVATGINALDFSNTDLIQNSKIYYSELESPTKDITDPVNKWKLAEDVTDWSKIKSYAIDMNDYEINNGDEVVFYYDVEIPEGVNYNDVAYSCYAVYFDIKTEGGKLSLATEPTKVGLKIVNKFDFVINKYKMNSNKKIQGVTYKLSYEEKDTEGVLRNRTRIVTTNEEGIGTIKNLHVDVNYTLEEIKVPNTIVLNEAPITFYIDEDGVAHVSGNVKNSDFFSEGEILTIDLEDEVKYNVKINKTKKNEELQINNIKFNLKYNSGEDEKSITIKTQNGEAIFEGLMLNTEYILTEIDGPSNIELKDGVFKFKLYRDEGIIKYSVLENTLGTLSENIIEENDNLMPTFNVNIKNEIRYSVNLTKIDLDGNNINGTEFSIKGKGFPDTGKNYYSMDGKVLLPDLYVDEEYTIEEIKSAGYYLDKEKDNTIKIKVTRNESGLELVSSIGEGLVVDEDPILTENGLDADVKITVKNEKIPTCDLNIIKQNEQDEIVPGAQFKLTSLDDGTSKTITIDNEGKGTFQGVYEYVEGKPITGEYTLEETYAPSGYKIPKDILKFKLMHDGDNVRIVVIEGEDLLKLDTETEEPVVISSNDSVTITIINKPIFTLYKKGDKGVFLTDAKFMVQDVNGNAARDTSGNYIGDFENIEINFNAQNNETYQWVKDENNTWYSGNSNVANSNSILQSESFYVDGNYYLSFYWAIVSKDSNDYLKYEIYNATTNTIIYQNTIRGSSTQEENGEDITYQKVTTQLSAGTYYIKYTYSKDSSEDNGTDKGYIKDINCQSMYRIISTDESGKISLNLAEGLYKIIEMKAPDRYQTPNKVADRTSYFGIGQSREEITSGTIDSLEWAKSVSSDYVSRFNDVTDVPQEYGGGIVAVGTSDINTNISDTTEIEGKGNLDGIIVKYNEDGSVAWAKIIGGIKDDELTSIVNVPSGGYVVVGYTQTKNITYDGSTIQVNGWGNEDGIILKIDENGNLVKTQCLGGRGSDIIKDVAVDSNGNVAVTGSYRDVADTSGANTTNSVYMDKEANNNRIISANTDGLKSGYISVYDSNLNYKWHKDFTGTDEVYGNAVTETSTGFAVGVNFLPSDLLIDETYVATSNGRTDAFLISYNIDGTIRWSKQLGSTYDDIISDLTVYDDPNTENQKDIVVVGSFVKNITIDDNTVEKITQDYTDKDGMIVKLKEDDGSFVKSMTIGGTSDDEIASVKATRNGGLIVGGEYYSFNQAYYKEGNGTNIQLSKIPLTSGKNDGFVLVIDKNDKAASANAVNGTSYDKVNGVAVSEKTGLYAVGEFASKSLNESGKTILTNTESYFKNGFVLKYKEIVLVPEVPESTEITIENELIEYKITTEILGNTSRGSITGVNNQEYTGNIKFVESVKNGYDSQVPIIIKPNNGYNISAITINGEDYEFDYESDEVTIPSGYFTNVQNNYHIQVCFGSETNSLKIEKKDTNGNPLEGAKFKITTNNDRVTPGAIEKNGESANKYYADKTKEVEFEKILNGTGPQYGEAIISEPVEGVIGDMTKNGTYYFAQSDDKYISTNKNVSNTTANSYMMIDLTENEGDYVVVVNAEIQSEGADYGYATIQEYTGSTSAPTYSNTNGRFIYISGNPVDAKDYTSLALQGGKKYILHFGYRKDRSVNSGSDTFTINSVMVYKATTKSYNFELIDGKYVPNNKTNVITVANSYIPINLSGKTGKYVVVVDGEINAANNEYLYATITTNTTAPAYNSSTGRFMYLYGNKSEKEYEYVLNGGSQYYLHLGYVNQTTTDKVAVIHSIKIYEARTYYFEEQDGKYVSNNIGKNDTVAYSYIPVDLRDCYGEYDITINASIFGNSSDRGIAMINTSTNAPSINFNDSYYYYYYTWFLHLSGLTTSSNTVRKAAGSIYYIHVGYYNAAGDTTNGDRFVINSITVTPVSKTYYTETNSQGLALTYYDNSALEGTKNTDLPNGKYTVEEIESPENYVLSDEIKNIDIISTISNPTLEFVNKKKPIVITHHYLREADGTLTTNKVAEDEIQVGELSKPYVTEPRYDLEYLKLQEDEEGNPIIPENSTGVFGPDGDETIEVNYYYEAAPIELTIHHYIDGTENKLVSDEVIRTDSIVTFEEEYKYTVTAGDSYDISNNSNYNELISDYILTRVTTKANGGSNKKRGVNDVDISDVYEYSTNSEINYYYRLKTYNITTEVVPHDENRINRITNEKENISVEGGNITGYFNDEYQEVDKIKFVEEVNINEKSTVEIVATPDSGYRVLRLSCITTDEDGMESEPVVIYETGTIVDSDISCILDENNGSVHVATFNNVDTNIHICAEFEAKYGTVVTHHRIRGQEDDIDTSSSTDLVGEPYATGKIEIDHYKLVETSDNTEGLYNDETIDVYYWYDTENYQYIVNYYYDNVKDTSKTDKILAKYQTVVSNYKNKIINGYKLEKVETSNIEGSKTGDLPLTISDDITENVINVYYVKSDEKVYTVHYYYDGIEDVDKAETLTAEYKSIVTTYEDKSDGYALEKVEPVDTNGDLHLEITSNPDDNRINVFYRTEYSISTEVKLHTEREKDGTTKDVKGGSISGDGIDLFESVFKGDDSSKVIVVVPNEGYQISSVKINNASIDFENLLSASGSLTLSAENGFFTDINEDKHVEVEFRKTSGVIVKYLEKDTEEVLATQEEIQGKEGEIFETARKSVSYYQAVNITDENGNAISTYSRVTSDDELSATGTMYADTLTIIYWYKKIPSGIIVKHIAINEADKDDLDMEDGTILDEEYYEEQSSSKTINRKVYSEEDDTTIIYKDYISTNGPTSLISQIIIALSDEDSKIVVQNEDNIVEVRFYYERQYKVITESRENGTISGEDDDVYEYINDRGFNSNEIVITPDSGYRVKEITINGTIYPLSEFNEDATSHVITLGAGSTNAFFTDVQEDKNVSVEFEKIPAKVVVKYLDTATGEEVVGTPEKLVEGYVGDSYNEPAINIPGYILADDTTEHPLPTNASGPMTEADIEVVYWYTKQFTITTSAGEGGSSIIEENVDKEVVTRGNNNTLKITMTPDDGYEIDKILINDVELDYENDSNIVIGDGYVEIPANYFTNVQENIYVVVEFARIPARVKVEYLDGETNESLFVDEDGNEYETIEGYVNKEYTTTPKDIPYYEVIEERLPRNANGRMSKDEITVTYYYRKSKFNMKVEKEILNVVVNNETVESNNKKNVETIVKYNDISSVSIKAVYKIKVTNTEEVAGTAVLDEQIPEGFEIDLTESEGNWQLVDGKYTLTTDEILPGESKEYIIILKWIVSDTNQGTKTNIALITDTTNGANYEETTTDDNESSAIISITLEKVEEEIDEPEVDIRDKEIEPELIVPDSINEEPVISKKIKSIKTGDELYYYIAIVIIAEVMIVIAIRKKNK